MPASPLGKIKMVAQVVAILALILGDVYWPDLLFIGAAGVVGGGRDRAGVRGRLLCPLQPAPQSPRRGYLHPARSP